MHKLQHTNNNYNNTPTTISTTHLLFEPASFNVLMRCVRDHLVWWCDLPLLLHQTVTMKYDVDHTYFQWLTANERTATHCWHKSVKSNVKRSTTTTHHTLGSSSLCTTAEDNNLKLKRGWTSPDPFWHNGHHGMDITVWQLFGDTFTIVGRIDNGAHHNLTLTTIEEGSSSSDRWGLLLFVGYCSTTTATHHQRQSWNQ